MPPALFEQNIKNAFFSPSSEPAEFLETNWHKVVGVRLKRFKRVVADKEEMFMFQVLQVVMEPLRFLAFLFMSYSSRMKDYSEWPPLFNILWSELLRQRILLQLTSLNIIT